MNLNKYLLPIVFAACATLAQAQANDPPKLSVKVPGTAKAGATVKAVVTITFAPGLHAYQNPPSNPDLIPITLTVDTKGVKVKSVKYPQGKDEAVGGDPTPVRVYEDTISVPVTVVVPKKKGKLKLSFHLNYQQCNSQSCYPPTDVTADVPLTVK